jgi:hypothetical protein
MSQVRQKAVYEWMPKFYVTASALVSATYGKLTADERDKIADDALYNTRFAFCKEPHASVSSMFAFSVACTDRTAGAEGSLPLGMGAPDICDSPRTHRPLVL